MLFRSQFFDSVINVRVTDKMAMSKLPSSLTSSKKCVRVSRSLAIREHDAFVIRDTRMTECGRGNGRDFQQEYVALPSDPSWVLRRVLRHRFLRMVS